MIFEIMTPCDSLLIEHCLFHPLKTAVENIGQGLNNLFEKVHQFKINQNCSAEGFTIVKS